MNTLDERQVTRCFKQSETISEFRSQKLTHILLLYVTEEKMFLIILCCQHLNFGLHVNTIESFDVTSSLGLFIIAKIITENCFVNVTKDSLQDCTNSLMSTVVPTEMRCFQKLFSSFFPILSLQFPTISGRDL